MLGVPYNAAMSKPSHPPKIPYRRAVRAFGRAASLARALGVSRASVSEWKKKGRLPRGRVWQLMVLRPDVFGAQPGGER